MRSRWLLLLAWAFPAVAIGAISVWLLSLGGLGANIAQVLELTLALAALVPLANKGIRESITPRAIRTDPNPKAMLALVAVVVVGIVAGILVWFFASRADLNVTSDLRLTNAHGMAHGSQAVIDGGDQLNPPRRSNLALKLSVHNPAKTGACESPARLTIGLVVDGMPLRMDNDVRPIRSGQEVRLDLSDVTRTVQIVVVLEEQDQACAVDLIIDRAVLYA